MRGRIQIIFRDELSYPSRLRDAEGPPFLFVQGNIDLLQRIASVAVVGTREPTDHGRSLAAAVTSTLTGAGYVVISGLAEGIDAEVHTACLDRGGETIAVLGNGLNVDFPASNRDLRRRILQSGGTVVTEYLLAESYSKASFVQRNRIQAALAGAIIPIECRRQSGTAHTIRFARELGRLLVGVEGRTPAPSTNEVYDLLADTAAPVVPLSDLLTRLLPLAKDLHPPEPDSDRLWRRVYRPLLLNLRDLIQRRGPTKEEGEWLIEAIRRILDSERT
jgi:DNA protecting protein DprA